MLFSGFPANVESIDSGLFVPLQMKKQNGMDSTELYAYILGCQLVCSLESSTNPQEIESFDLKR